MSPTEQAIAARKAARVLASLTGDERAALLIRMADALNTRAEEVLAANAVDMAAADAAVQAGEMSTALAARLALSKGKLAHLGAGLRQLAAAPDPLGRRLRKTELADGLVLEQTTSPMGVLLVIFESRPDAVPQIASLAIKSGNGLLLKGGREAVRSNQALVQVLREAIDPVVPAEVIGLVQTREEVADLLALDEVIDLVIPRGSGAMVRAIQGATRIPVMGHADGVCHVYVDGAADMDRAKAIVVDAKADYPAACNAMETLLVHRSWARDGRMESLLDALRAADVRLHQVPGGDLGLPDAPALRHEYGELAATVAVVSDIDAAIDHIHAHGSGHTDCIVTEDPGAAARFLARVDSASVFHNASTRFADGFRYGLGAEVGISTSRIHARGPVGVDGLLTTRWLLTGQGDTVAPFSRGERSFTHRPL
jgi:delta-1-pyrroline-5-carboxylate synthetase